MEDFDEPNVTKMADDCIIQIDRNDGKSWYEVHWNDGHAARFPYVFLFDNCRCPKCFHPNSYQRSVLMANIDANIQPTSHEIIEDGAGIQVTWPNGHASPFPGEWLKRHHFEKKFHDPLDYIKPSSWGHEMVDTIPVFKYKDIMADNKVLYNWLSSLITVGLALVKDAPKEDGVIKQISERVAWNRTTIYGKTFNVITMHDACSLAYTSVELGMHTDLPGYIYTPGVQMLHCIQQVRSEGGDNQFVDGLRLAEQLEREDPDMFKTLTNMKIDFRTCGAEYIPYHVMTVRPVIEYDREGNFLGINYNDGVRAPYWSLPVEEVTNGYKALKTFHRAMYRKDNFFNLKMQDGDIVTFNNRRVMHGRSAFTVEVKEGENSKVRHLEGGYLDWDEIKSRMRLMYEETHNLLRF